MASEVMHNSTCSVESHTPLRDIQKKTMGPPEGVGQGGNSGPASSLHMTHFRTLVVVLSLRPV
ncbi:hypothetical protein EMIT0P43_20400 [Pseudomonas jessenii]